MAEVTAAQVKQLRDVSGAGMMDCKKALVANGGDLEKAKDWLREKGLARAAGKAGRSTHEGAIGHYLHTSGGLAKLGVLVEVNCESDFVAKTDDFKELAHDLAIQVAGANPQYVRREEVPAALVEREKAVYRRQVEGKPANIIDKIVEGKLEAFFGEICLVDQVYVRDESRKKKVRELISEKVAKLGENITVARFARVAVGEAADEAAGENGAAAPASS
ncbi:MAG: translation elongation factor Ts [Candidatus Dormibacteria bacterium]